MIAGNNRLHCGNDYLHLGDDYLRTEDDRRCRIDNRVRQGNGSLQHDNDRGRCTNNRSRGGKDRVVDRVDRRGNGNTCFAIVNDSELIGTTVLSKGKTGGMEAAETGVSDVKQPACLVCFVVLPSTPAYKACGVPFLTR